MLYAKFMYPNSGYSCDKEEAKKAGLKVGEYYKVENVIMEQSYCSIFLEGIEGIFNSVQFEFEKDGKPYDIFDDPEYNPYLNCVLTKEFFDKDYDTHTYSTITGMEWDKCPELHIYTNEIDVEKLILHTENKDYVLDFQKLLENCKKLFEDYGIEVKE